ncbi:hypothetical protein [Mycolicibacterium lutetiense]|uniref:Uncharacterized protein n=1 Tax=Mycolicibacterium lutetiense TaxID=1641992 RepID=A0ABS5A2R5_9MYCO|nr:hypothetical protein [Mycolicibacterium lutetiense]MBP2456063.1 hypothetical protein [Mycolicibacterium lutetiense]
MKRQRRRCALALTVAFLGVTVACASHDDPVGRTLGSHAESSTSPELVKQATEFGGIAIPPGAEVLQAHVDSAMDTSYQLVLKMPSTDLPTLLTESHFTGSLTRVYPPFEPVIAGPDLAGSPSVVSAQDRYRNTEGKSVYRTVIVDEREPNVRFVHLNMNTT